MELVKIKSERIGKIKPISAVNKRQASMAMRTIGSKISRSKYPAETACLAGLASILSGAITSGDDIKVQRALKVCSDLI